MTSPKQVYQPPALQSVKVFLPMLALTSGGTHHLTKKPFPPFR